MDRVRLARGAMAAVLLLWTGFWSYLAVTEFMADTEHSPGGGEWAARWTGLRPQVLEPVRFLVFALLPGAFFLVQPWKSAAGWMRPGGWRTGRVLAGWLAAFLVPAAISFLLMEIGAIPSDPTTGDPYEPGHELGIAVAYILRFVLLGVLVTLLARRMGSLRTWDAGGALAVVAGATWTGVLGAESYAIVARMLGGFAEFRVMDAVNWALVALNAAVLARWMGSRPSPRPLPWRAAVAGAISIGLMILLTGSPFAMLMMTTLLLVLIATLHALWRWESRLPAAN